MDSWKEKIVPLLLLVQKRSSALQQGDIAKATEAEQQVFRGLRSVEGFGQQAREEFIDAGSSELNKTVIATGDAWAKWAVMIRSQAGFGASYRTARTIADLGAKAIGLQRQAYRLAGEPIPPEFQTSP